MSVISNYVVTGMACGNCVSHVSEELAEIPGVTGIKLDVAGELVITSQDAIGFDAVKAAVEEAGNYTVAAV